MSQDKGTNIGASFLVDSKSYFAEEVDKAMKKLKFEASPMATDYLVEILQFHMMTSNINIQGTFAEMLLRAAQAEKNVRMELLKKLGDTSLYISGFFGDSLKRKIIDIDYYANIGGMAYGSLASDAEESMQSEVFKIFSNRFLDFVDVLTYVSQSSAIQSNQDVLRIYEKYILTGSPLAKEQLIEMGLLNTNDLKKVAQ